MAEPLPSWLKLLAAQRVRVRAVIGHGANLLVEGAASAYALGGSAGGSTSWPKGFLAKLKNLPLRAGLEPGLLRQSRREFGSELAGRLLAARGLEGEERLSAAILRSVLQRTGRPLARDLREPAIGDAAFRVPYGTASTPQSLMIFCYSQLDSLKGRRQLGPIDADLVLLIGAGRIGWTTWQYACDFCFRLSLPNSRYCAEHTLSKEGRGDAKERQQRYQMGKLIAPAYCASRQATTLFNCYGWAHETAVAASRLLWRSPTPAQESSLRTIKEQLRKSPHLLQAIGDDILSTKLPSLEDELRRRVDPLAYRLGEWLPKLRAAEKWYRLADELCPGVRGRGRQSQSRIRRAQQLAGMGLPKSEVARRLGVHSSTISKWLSRAPEHEDVKRLGRLFK